MKLIIGLVLVLQIGCASVSEKTKDFTSEKESEIKLESKKPAEKETKISPEVLYLLMTAEIAGQRKQYGVSLQGYLQAAKLSDDPKISERAAKIALFLKDAKRTEQAVSLWLQQDPDNLTARKLAAFAAMRNGKKTEAVEHLNSILEKDPAGFESTIMELTKVFEKEGKADFMFDVLEDISKAHKNQASVYFVQALLAGRLQKLQVAEEKVNQALALQPDWERARILQAQIAAQTGDFQKAKDVLEKLLEKTPKNNRIKKMLAQVLVKSKAYDDAIEIYKSMLEDKPDDGESLFAISLVYLQQNREDDALVYLKKLVNQPSWDAQASFYIGRIEFKKERYDEALVWFDKVTAGPYAYEAAINAVSVLVKQNKSSAAEARLAKLSSRYPKQKLNILLLKAEIYNDQKKYIAAFDVLTQGLEQFPQNKELLYTRALIAEKLDRLDVLEADLKKILAQHPDDANVLNALGYTLVDRTTRYDEAAVFLEKAIKLKPDETVIIDSIGWLQYKQGKIKEALASLRRAYNKQPESEIAAHLAEVLWKVGEKTEAMSVFNKALKQTPDDEYLLKLLKQIPALKEK